MAGQAHRLARPSSALGRTGGFVAGAERHHEGRSLTDAGAADFDLAAVQPHQIVDDRQTEPQAAVSTRRRAVRLPEAIEHVGQKGGIDADAGVRDFDPDARVGPRRGDRDAAAARA